MRWIKCLFKDCSIREETDEREGHQHKKEEHHEDKPVAVVPILVKHVEKNESANATNSTSNETTKAEGSTPTSTIRGPSGGAAPVASSPEAPAAGPVNHFAVVWFKDGADGKIFENV
jgi:hypothetical protein